ncbi:MAG: sigma-70 family RNA polymerase sigma factor [Anaerolineales bacterium]|nr:sigma-70 family RNA polymerase sigma factor [Anaerolineales bacterium]
MRQSVVNSAPDSTLIVELQQGDLDALGELYDRHRRMVFRTALAITNDEEAASDLLQDVFLRLFRFADRVDPSRPMEPWLYRVTTNLAYTYMKRQKRWWRAIKDMADWLARESRPTSESYAEKEEECNWVRQAITTLPMTHRVVIVLYYVNNQSIQEISEILDIPVGTVKSRLYYGRQTLKKKLGMDREFSKEVNYEFT